MIKKAMIMAAGVGSRLGLLSNIVPKPLVPLANVPTMDIIIKHLELYGIKDIIANTFYKADMIKEYYKNKYPNANYNFIKEEKLSGTAGGVKKCQFFFDKGEDFIVLSGDGLSDIDIKKAYESHKNSGAIATIVLKEIEHKNVPLYGIVVPDKKGFVDSFQEKPPINMAKSNLANTGIYIFSYEIFNFIPENTFYDFAKNVFPSILASGLKINTFVTDGYWSDIGSIEQYKKSNFDILLNGIKAYNPKIEKIDGAFCILGKNVIIEENVRLNGKCIIGSNCRIRKNSSIKDSVIWNNAEINDNVIVENSIILSDEKVKENLKDRIYSNIEMAV